MPLKDFCCIHYETQMRIGEYVDVIIDEREYGFCHKCFKRFHHKRGVVVIRYVVLGKKFTPQEQVPF